VHSTLIKIVTAFKICNTKNLKMKRIKIFIVISIPTFLSRLNVGIKCALHPEITSDKTILKEIPYQKDQFKV
jgi:hypothetical protein